MNDNNSWEELDSAVSNLLVGAAFVFERVELLEKSIYDQGSLLFGFLPRKEKSLSGLIRRAQHSIKLVTEKNELLARINNTSDQCTKDSLQTLLENVRTRLRILRHSESSRKRRWKIKKANQQFLKNPYQAGKAVLDPKCEIQLQCDQSSLDTFKAKILSDPSRNIPLPPLDGLHPAPTLLKNFDSTSVRYQDLFPILNSRRNASSPGINMIPYRVYKKCPRITSFLFKIFKPCLKLSNVPIQCRIASEVYIPKKKPPNPSAIEDFRPIALLNVEGKLFFSLIAMRLEEHIIQKNRIVNLSIQKGCMAKIPGCWEHMSLVWDELKIAKSNKTSITAIWLGIANAYGSIPHQLISILLSAMVLTLLG